MKDRADHLNNARDLRLLELCHIVSWETARFFWRLEDTASTHMN